MYAYIVSSSSKDLGKGRDVVYDNLEALLRRLEIELQRPHEEYTVTVKALSKAPILPQIN